MVVVNLYIFLGNTVILIQKHFALVEFGALLWGVVMLNLSDFALVVFQVSLWYLVKKI